MRKIILGGKDLHSLSDIEIIKKITLWDHAAFEIIYDRYNKPLYNYVWNLLNFNSEEAGLVLSEVFIKTFEYTKNKKIDNLKSLLYRIAHNTAIDRIRKNQNQEITIGDESTNYKDPQDKIEKEKIDTNYKIKLMKKYLSMLDEKYRSVLYLVYYQDKSYDEIAVIQNSNKNSIGTLVLQGKKKLKEIMINDGIDPDIFAV